MAFIPGNLSRISGNPESGNDAPLLWTYGHPTDTKSTINAADYFVHNGASPVTMKVGDIILIHSGASSGGGSIMRTVVKATATELDTGTPSFS